MRARQEATLRDWAAVEMLFAKGTKHLDYPNSNEEVIDVLKLQKHPEGGECEAAWSLTLKLSFPLPLLYSHTTLLCLLIRCAYRRLFCRNRSPGGPGSLAIRRYVHRHSHPIIELNPCFLGLSLSPQRYLACPSSAVPWRVSIPMSPRRPRSGAATFDHSPPILSSPRRTVPYFWHCCACLPPDYCGIHLACLFRPCGSLYRHSMLLDCHAAWDTCL